MPIKVNKYFPIILIYFFFNAVFLPEGLLYTNILTPLFIFWIWKKDRISNTLKFFLYSIPFVLIYLTLGVQWLSFMKSYLLLFSTFIFTYTFHLLLKKKPAFGSFFKPLLIINFLFTLVALAIFFTPFNTLLWTIRDLTLNIENFPRLQLLTYEPSYYSTLLAPIVIFYLLKIILKKEATQNVIGYLILCLLPLFLSFSLGVIITTSLSIMIMILSYQRFLFKKKALFHAMITIVVSSTIILVFLLLFFPDNPLFGRIGDILSGNDISAQGRTVDAIKMATLVAKTKSLLFGVGPGQIKVMGDEVVRNYYNYNAIDMPIIRIPSSIGETLGTFGIFGLIVRLGFEVYLFIKTKVFNNVYRFTIFIYIFIYQFAGSYLTNVAEYVLWVIAFTPSFPQFQLTNFISSVKENLER